LYTGERCGICRLYHHVIVRAAKDCDGQGRFVGCQTGKINIWCEYPDFATPVVSNRGDVDMIGMKSYGKVASCLIDDGLGMLCDVVPTLP
jgi:hypothetical protein